MTVHKLPAHQWYGDWERMDPYIPATIQKNYLYKKKEKKIEQ